MIAPPSVPETPSLQTPADPGEAPPDPPQPLRVLDHSHRWQTWTAVVTAPFASKPSSFLAALEQMVQHPEHNTSWILRSDTLSDTLHPPSHSSSSFSSSSPSPSPPSSQDYDTARTISVPGYTVTRTLVRRFVPRNPARDAPAVQTCLFLSHTAALTADGDAGICELVAFVAHSDDAASTPYYLPSVRGVGWLLFPSGKGYALSLLYAFFPATETDAVNGQRLQRTAGHLLARAQKLAAGLESGYVQRVHHDLVVPRETFQDLYLALRGRHAGRLLAGWREKTDPRKHVFEDILIATFLICLWERMFPSKHGWEGFADVGCGNGVLVDVLLREGWSGVGIDARARKSWDGFCPETRRQLLQRVLVPWLLAEHEGHGHEGHGQDEHDGRFDEGTFIISNHADELTAWTPLLAAGSNCPFLAIPCCSHDLSGAKKRFPPPSSMPQHDDDDDGRTGDLRQNANASKSTYSSLCAYVERLARDCGWRVEREVLRIPSTRNVAIVGRHRVDRQADAAEVLRREGCGKGWRERAHALKRPSSGH